MNKDLVAINEEIDKLMQKPISFDKYERLCCLFICKHFIEKSFVATDQNTVTEILEYKMDNIGARSALVKLAPILSRLIKDLEMISPTISGEFVRKLKEM